MQLAIVLTSLLISIITALVVLQKNPRSGTHVYFGLLVAFIGIYPVFNYLAINSATDNQAFFWSKLILLVSIPQGPLLFSFAKTFPNTRLIFNKKIQGIIMAWVLLNMVLAVSGMIFKSVEVKDGAVAIQPGALVPSFGLLHASSIIAGLAVLYMKYRQSLGRARQQLALIFYGILISFSLTFLITFILPVVLKNTFLLSISPIFLSLSVVVAAYAIVRHKLFDIRAAVARSAAYLLSLTSIGFIYGFLVFGILSRFINSQTSTEEQALYVSFALLTAILFRPTKLFFDKITNKIFYQDAYDPQVLLDQLNRILVSNVEIESLLKQAGEELEKHLKVEYCVFNLRPTSYVEARSIGSRKIKLSEADTDTLHGSTPSIHHRIIVADELIDSPTEEPLYEVMQKHDIVILGRLVATLKYDLEGIGYLMLGPKKSGNQYTSQDINVIRIITNELVIAIENALRFEEIENFNITLQEKVDEATKQLRKTNEKLKALDETKDEFISMASHQLRTPLTSVKGYLSMVLEGDAGKITQNQRKLLDQAFVSSQRMVFLIADLLNVSRLRTGKFVIETKETNLEDVVEGEVGQLIETAQARGLELTYKKPDSFPSVMLDETKIRQVIMNFIDNAIYYTPSGGHITVKLEETDETIEYTVTDDGIGVPKSEQPHLFSKFYRAGNAKKARPDGTGLGLFMAKKVIVAQGGALIFTSQEGKGSTFGFKFAKNKIVSRDSKDITT